MASNISARQIQKSAATGHAVLVPPAALGPSNMQLLRTFPRTASMVFKPYNLTAVLTSLPCTPQVLERHCLRRECGVAPMTPARRGQPSMSQAAKQRRIAVSMLRIAWLTFSISVAYMILALGGPTSMSRAGRTRRTVVSMLQPVWWVSVRSDAHIALALRDRRGVS